MSETQLLNKELILNFLKKNSRYIRENFHVVRIGLIGSFARGEETEFSDIDFMVEFEPGTDDLYNTKIRLKEYLQSNFRRNVDICREKYIKPYIKEFIMKEVIYV